jgi:hypothetical protein
MAARAYNLFPHLLADLGHGYALWCPEPCYYDEVRVGDVGYLSKGRFHRLFNCTLSADHPLNATFGVPEDFTPQTGPLVEKLEPYFSSGPIQRGNISRREFGVSGEG